MITLQKHNTCPYDIGRPSKVIDGGVTNCLVWKGILRNVELQQIDEVQFNVSIYSIISLYDNFKK